MDLYEMPFVIPACEYAIFNTLQLFDDFGRNIRNIYEPCIVGVLLPASMDASTRNVMDIPHLKFTCDTTLPLQFADLDLSNNGISDEEILSLVEKYGLPHQRGGKVATLKNGREVSVWDSLAKFRTQLARLKAASLLWRGFIERNIHKVKRLLILESAKNGGTWAKFTVKDVSCAYFVSWSKIFASSYDEIFDVALKILCKMISDGLHDFSTPTSIWHDTNARIHIEYGVNGPYSYTWKVLLDDLSDSRKRRQWHYKQCRSCGAWEDMSKPKRRASRWTRCDQCVKMDKSRYEMKRRDEKRGGAPKRPRGRPKTK